MIRLFIMIVAVGLPLSATIISWNLSSNPTFGPLGTVNGSGFGNNFTSATVGGAYVVARAYGVTNQNVSPTGTETARVGRYSTGLGICNQNEGLNCIDHQVDSFRQNEYMIFSFFSTGALPLAVSEISILVDPYGAWDRDIQYSFKTTSGAPTPTPNSTYPPTGFGALQNLSGTVSTSGVVQDLGGAGVYHLLVRASGLDNDIDRWKITKLRVCFGRECEGGDLETPEPGTYGLMAAGLLALGFRKRLRK